MTKTASNDDDFESVGNVFCESIPDGLPSEWHDLDLRISVSLILTEYNCVNRSFFTEFAAASIEEAITKLVRNHETFLCYSIMADRMDPAFAYDADWPLLRQGAEVPRKRNLVQGSRPWDWCVERTLFEVRNEQVTPYSSRMYLRVGGRSPDDATLNWMKTAKVIRKIRKNVIAAQQSLAVDKAVPHG